MPRPFECVKRSWHSDRHQPLRGSIIQQIFRVVNENHSSVTKKNREWQEKLAVVVLKSEEILYSKANSEADYLDPETLWDRLNDAIDTIIRKDETLETGEFLQPCVEGSSCYPQNVPRQMMFSESRSSSVYPLYHGFQLQPRVPQLGFDNTHIKPNNIIIGTPVFQTTRESLPSFQTGRTERLLLYDKDSNGSKRQCSPAVVECDLSLRLGLVSSDERGLTIVDDVDSGQSSKEFAFFPMNSEADEGGILMTDVRKRKTVPELQSFVHLECDFSPIKERIKRQGL